MASISPNHLITGSDNNPNSVILPMLDTQPLVGRQFDEPDIPNKIYGWYNGVNDMVELYVVSGGGTHFVRLTTFRES